MLIDPYDEMTETLMIRTFNNMTEKQRRQYAAVEAYKLGHGGIKYVSNLFGINRRTIRAGMEELKKTTFVPPGE